MSTYGRQVLHRTGDMYQVAADGNPVRKALGITIDWSSVAAVAGSDATYADGTVVPVGKKGLEVGNVLVKIDATGLYGPYDSAETDGRQNLERGNVVILNTTVLEQAPLGLLAVSSDHPDVLEGGLVWKARVKMGGASQPTQAAVEAALPLLRYAE